MAQHRTTVGFDPTTWGLLGAEAARLGISKGELIRAAVLLHLGEQRARHRLSVVEQRLDQLVEQVRTVARALLRLGVRVASG